ncbi:pyruvate formate-lyase-activating protein [Desulfitobacterium metallireducens]|uniref:Pyruvate formate-lyase-activating enzyme n=1 Tax=Desulfitobacterium metallireducens DSM 15288 TaxID=871968 RepID=W0E5G1_9FIRM|nr:pyruvate formate-lyase-activating protein [Desulfitobacterium metallireducens]AHF06105.1 pyruvate formate lyase-activating protein [Desulfitobacterium metallireducens DSM 15288]
MKGRIHSIESFGTVDGPGIRCVVFLQGCSLRCRYCHNPDTWDCQGGQEIDSEEVVQKVLRFKSYFGEKGGITLSGGEPLLQPDFAAAILKRCKEEGIHTAVDTSGWVDISALDKVLPYTDLFLLDIKGLNEENYTWITGQKTQKFHEALQLIKEKKTDLWLRYVVLPGINDTDQHREKLKEFVQALSPQVQNVELLPYHPLGIHKWEKLGLKYTLYDLEIPNQDKIDQFSHDVYSVFKRND